MQVKVLLVRAKDNKRIEKTIDISTLEKSINTFNLFYPVSYKAYAIYDMDRFFVS